MSIILILFCRFPIILEYPKKGKFPRIYILQALYSWIVSNVTMTKKMLKIDILFGIGNYKKIIVLQNHYVIKLFSIFRWNASMVFIQIYYVLQMLFL